MKLSSMIALEENSRKTMFLNWQKFFPIQYENPELRAKIENLLESG